MANCQSYSTIFVFPRVLASCLQQPSSSSLSRFCFVAVELSTSIRPCFSTRFGAYPYSTVNVDMKSEGLNQLISFDDGGVVELGYIIYIYGPPLPPDITLLPCPCHALIHLPVHAVRTHPGRPSSVCNSLNARHTARGQRFHAGLISHAMAAPRFVLSLSM